MPELCHLHCHTQYSLLDGAARIETLLKRAGEHEIGAVAITDHGNLYGVPEFCLKAEKAGIQPIIGCEFYVTPSGIGDKTDRTRYHQVLLAKSEEGYANLMRLSSKSFLEGYYYKPRIDKDLIKAHSSGLIATTCCLQSEVQQAILHQSEETARKIFEFYLDIFGENYFIEFQDHSIPEQQKCNEVLLRWSRDYGVKTIATNDVHYVDQRDANAHDVLLCIQTGKDLSDPNRLKFSGDHWFLKNTEQMRGSFTTLPPADVDIAIANTRLVADECKFTLSPGDLLMPHFPIPDGFENDMDKYLRHLTYERAKSRYPEMTQDVVERLDSELAIIAAMGYAGYFLIVQDFTTAARELDVRVGPGRGSAAGSAVAFCLGITNIEPLKYNLLFERFLNPERVSMPDIDIDFDDKGRAKVIDYVVEKYGRDSVCQIVTFGTMGARSAIRDVSRVLGIPRIEADRIAKLIPESAKAEERSMAAALKVPEFKQLTKSDDPKIRQLIEFSQTLEGSARHTGVHAAGVIIAPGNLSEYVPVAVQRGKSGSDDVVVTQFEGKLIEDFGLLKMDFLGLKTLSIINDTLELIEQNRGETFDIDEIPLDRPEPFKLFAMGETIGIFQFESEGMREWLKKLKPDRFEDLIAMNALYRPGPMDLIPSYVNRRHGREEVSYPHDSLKEILEPSYGLPIYQEQVMQMAQAMAGYSLGQADILRRAMGKKKQSEMDKQRAVFVEGASARGVDEKKANEVFDMMAKFAGYGFNRSHSAAYSVVAYQTAYLKALYPKEFLAAVLTNEISDSKKLAILRQEALRMNTPVLPPSVLTSGGKFSVEETGIRCGLAAINGVGLMAAEHIRESREKAEPITSLFDFCESVDLKTVNKKAIECLISAGALDELEGHRAQNLASLEAAYKFAQRAQADLESGQNSLFGGGGTETILAKPRLMDVPPATRIEELHMERDLLGFYISGHPLEDYEPTIRALGVARLARPETYPPGKNARFAGVITEANHRVGNNGRGMAFITMEDLSGPGEFGCFGQTYEQVRHLLNKDEVLLFESRVDDRGGRIRLNITRVLKMQDVRDRFIKSITLRVAPDLVVEEDIQTLQDLCARNKGQCKLYFEVFEGSSSQPLKLLSRSFVVDPSPELMRGIALLFGRDNISLQGELT